MKECNPRKYIVKINKKLSMRKKLYILVKEISTSLKEGVRK